jgi:hypothetical protein
LQSFQRPLNLIGRSRLQLRECLFKLAIHTGQSETGVQAAAQEFESPAQGPPTKC